MKVYRVAKGFYDGDHEHGQYESPLFASRELAEKFLAEVWGEDESKRWWSDSWGQDDPPTIEELNVLDVVLEVQKAKQYLCITYT